MSIWFKNYKIEDFKDSSINIDAHLGIEFLEIGRILPHINFLILGDGPLFQEISDFIKANNIKNILLKGALRKLLDYLYSIFNSL